MTRKIRRKARSRSSATRSCRTSSTRGTRCSTTCTADPSRRDTRRRTGDGVAGTRAAVEAEPRPGSRAHRAGSHRRGSAARARRPAHARSRRRQRSDPHRRRAGCTACIFLHEGHGGCRSTETDFSDIGAASPPSALGDFLGAAPAKRSSTQNGYEDVPVAIDAIDEEDVYTSASRPRVEAAPDDTDFPIDEPAAPPPRAMPPSPPRRTGPAIIRRATPVAVPLANYAPQASQVQEDSPFAENTRVADVTRWQSARAEARSKAPTAPPPFALHETAPQVLIDEDDYADIEIGADASEADAEPTPTSRRDRSAAPDRRARGPPPRESDEAAGRAAASANPIRSSRSPTAFRSSRRARMTSRMSPPPWVAEEDIAIGEMIPRRRPDAAGCTDIVQIGRRPRTCRTSMRRSMHRRLERRRADDDHHVRRRRVVGGDSTSPCRADAPRRPARTRAHAGSERRRRSRFRAT